jgi:SAM-dependent methyltransferase
MTAASTQEHDGRRQQPDLEYFEIMESHSASHWWYRARWALVRQLLRPRLPAGEAALDLGCGAGEVVRLLGDLGAEPALGTDFEPAIVGVAARAASGRVMVSSAETVPVADGSLGCLVTMDVIEHLDSDIAALRECRRALRPGGLLLVTVPAYDSLWSDHDEWAAHRRRYNRRTLLRTVQLAGFEVEWISYYNSFLVPPAFLIRRTPLRRLIEVGSEEDESASPLTDRVFTLLSRIERGLLARTTLPFGLSIGAIGRRPR